MLLSEDEGEQDVSELAKLTRCILYGLLREDWVEQLRIFPRERLFSLEDGYLACEVVFLLITDLTYVFLRKTSRSQQCTQQFYTVFGNFPLDVINCHTYAQIKCFMQIL